MFSVTLHRKVARWLILLLLLFSAPNAVGTAFGIEGHESLDASRAKLISYMIRKKFADNHYSHKKIDDELSRAAYSLFLKQLDYQKRFLLASDVKKLDEFLLRIDDEMNSGIIKLPAVAAELLQARVLEVKALMDGIFAQDFDFEKDEGLETDPEKREFPASLAERRELWRKIMKYEVANRYLTILEVAEAEKKAELEGKADKQKKAVSASEANEPKDPMQKARYKVRKNYDEIFARMLETKDQEHYDRYFDAFARAFDPHSSYMPPTQKEDFDIHMKGSLEGIGARLQEKDGFIKVVTIMPGGAAAQQGELDAEDVILKVGEGDEEPVDIVGMRIREAVGLIRGKKGTPVTLTVKKPDGRIRIIAIVRDVVQIEETFVKSAVLPGGKDEPKIGYIFIPSFYRDFSLNRLDETGRNSTDDTRQAIEELVAKRIDGLVLDLRNNGGGALMDAISIAGLFIKDGPIVQVKEGNGKIRVHEDDDPSISYRGPMLVLVNQFSASASEILAGALQDYGRAVIVGSEHTHGKGTVQTLIDLDRSLYWPNMQQFKPLGALKVTIQKFYRISGQSTQANGVIPDITLPDRMQYMKYGEKYSDYALPWDTIPATKFEAVNQINTKLGDLVQKSVKRVSANKKFEEIKHDIEKSRERRDHTVRSLTMAAIKAEREDVSDDDETNDMFGHGPFSEDFAKETAKMSAEEKRLKWIESVGDDPYVREAIDILASLKTG